MSTPWRSKLFPQLPTVAEAGVPGYEAYAWYGFVVPVKTPQSIIARLHQEIVKVLHAPDATQALLNQGLDVWTMTPEAFGAHIKSETEKWGRIIREAGISES